jgi:5-methyltetrahydropteroyltriglutamate--homocysteine methyltransferase
MIATVVSHYPKIGDHPGEQKLRQAIAKFEMGEIDYQALVDVEREVTKQAIREMEEAGIELVTDGQIRWQDPVTYICSKLNGFEINGLVRWFDSNTYFRQPVAVGDVAWVEPILVEDYIYARSVATVDVKPVVTGPYTLGVLSIDRYYNDLDKLVLALAAALNAELKELCKQKPPIIQIDEPGIAFNPSVRYPRDARLFLQALELLTKDIDCDLSLYIYHGSASDILQTEQLPVKILGLDMVHGASNWQLLENWPDGLGLGLGIVDARNVKMENVEHLATTIKQAKELIRSDEVHVSPSCGLEFLPKDVALSKLRLLAESVREARE